MKVVSLKRITNNKYNKFSILITSEGHLDKSLQVDRFELSNIICEIGRFKWANKASEDVYNSITIA